MGGKGSYRAVVGREVLDWADEITSVWNCRIQTVLDYHRTDVGAPTGHVAVVAMFANLGILSAWQLREAELADVYKVWDINAGLVRCLVRLHNRIAEHPQAKFWLKEVQHKEGI